MINCGILFNAKQNYFLPYLKWILKEKEVSNYFNLSGILTNDVEYLHDNCIDTPVCNSLEQLIERSDVVFSLGYWKIIKKEQILEVPIGIINFHHSYRLKYRGRHCSTWALRYGEKVHGSTMHFIDENLDEGRIIDTRSFLVQKNDTAEDLFFKANQVGYSMLKDNFQNVLKGNCAKLSIKHDKEFKYFKSSDLKHIISNDLINDEGKLLREIKSLTFDNKQAPYLMLGGKRVYLKLESHDDGILRKEKLER